MPIIKGVTSLLLICVITLILGIPLLILTLLKLLAPTQKMRNLLLQTMNEITLHWIGANLWWMRQWLKTPLTVEIPDDLSDNQWWLIISNHRSWTDIFMLFMALHRRIPMPRFFIKRALLWIPIIGQAFWALEFPVMRRYSRQQLAKNPKLAEIDRRATQRMCERAKDYPISIVIYVEGTRFTPVKREHQQSPYQHLLRPKAGGIAQVLNLMGDQLSGILDVTISYTNPSPTFWGFLCGTEQPVTLTARRLAVPKWMLDTQYHAQSQDKERFHQWINALWQEKDALLDKRTHHD
ncbi:acyltransferase [Halomonas sp. TBZ9]|uniref:Acyltransferase n=1 Tax=Vreelandella azerica TaxID=2732867 RepID=A0A7Y3TZ55_9GAMM|nr:acetyltransferase [Halomonas azerica]NOG32750.1 acyltransferase [Halomonas azerica]